MHIFQYLKHKYIFCKSFNITEELVLFYRYLTMIIDKKSLKHGTIKYCLN